MTVRLPGRSQNLHQLIEAVRKDGRRLIEIQGISGIGKTLLVNAFCDTMEEDHLVLQVGGGSVDVESRHVSLLHRVQFALETRLTPDDMAQIAALPVLADYFELVRNPQDKHDVGFEFAVEALLALFKELARRQPILFCIDDVHLLDQPGVSLLHELTDHPEAVALPLVTVVVHSMTEDPGLGDRWNTLVSLHPDSHRIRVLPLDEDGLAELVSQELDDSVVESLPELPGLLWRASNGHPFLAVQLLRSARREGALRATMRGWVLDGAYFDVARRLGGVLRGSIDHLIRQHPRGRFLLCWLDLAGGPVSLDPLAALDPGNTDALHRLAGEFSRAGILARYQTGERREGWYFAHSSWRSASTGLLESSERSEFISELLLQIEQGGESEDLTLELRSMLLLESDQDGARAKALALLEEKLESLGSSLDDQAIGIRVRMRALSLAEDRDTISHHFSNQAMAFFRIGDSESLRELFERFDPESLGTGARKTWCYILPDLLRMNDNGRGVLAWVKEQQKLQAEDPVRAVLLYHELIELRADASTDPRVPEILKELESLPLDADIHSLVNVIRINFQTFQQKDYEGGFERLKSLLDDPSLGNAARTHVYFKMAALAIRMSNPRLFTPFAKAADESARRASFRSIQQQRTHIERALHYQLRYEEEEKMLREDLRLFVSRKQTRWARERIIGLMGILRSQRRIGEAIELASMQDYGLDNRLESFSERAYLLTVASVYWRGYKEEESAEILELLDKAGVAEMIDLSHPYYFSRAMTAYLKADAGGDWSQALAAAEEILEIYRVQQRHQGVDAMHFDLIAARAEAELDRPTRRRAADYRSLIELARERRDYDLVRVTCGVMELAALHQDHELEDELAGWLETTKADRHIALLALAIRARRRSDNKAFLGLLSEALCYARNHQLEGFVRHALQRCGLKQQMDPVFEHSARQTAHFIHSLGEWLRRGLPVGFALEQEELDRSEWFARQAGRIRAALKSFAPLERASLEERYEQLELALFESGTRLAFRPGLQLFFFGGPRAWYMGEEVDASRFSSRVAHEMLFCLAYRQWQGRPLVTKDELLEMLRVEGEPMLAESSLKVVASRLRKGLKELTGKDLLPASRRGYQLAEDAVAWIDVSHFEQQARNAATAQREQRPEHAERSLQEATHVYTDRFGLRADGDWKLSLEAHFEDRFVSLLRERLRLLRENPNRLQEVIAETRRKHPELVDAVPELSEVEAA